MTDSDKSIPEQPQAEGSAKPAASDRIAKVIARAGLASRREAERMIVEGRVTVNGKKIDSPALDVMPSDKVAVDGTPLEAPQPTRLWMYYKPVGLVTTESDEKGRQTVFDALPRDLPRVMTVGRLDLNSEGLLLLTNDGDLKRRLELPSTGWMRRYRVRVNGQPTDMTFDPLRRGATIDGEEFQPMEIKIDSQKGANAWLSVGIREGKNREIRRAMNHIGLQVNRLIRIGYGPFKLIGMEENEVKEVRRRVLRDQLGGLLTGEEAGEAAPDARSAPRGRPASAGAGRGDRKPFPRRDGEEGGRKPFPRRDGEEGGRKPFPRRDGEEGGRKPFPRRDGEEGGRKPFPRRDGEEGGRKPFPRRDGEEGGRKPFPRRDGEEGGRKPYPRRDGEEGGRKPYPRRDGEEGGRKPFPRRDGEEGGRKPYPRRDGEEGGRKPYPRRDAEEGGRKPFPRRDGEEGGRRPFPRRDGEEGSRKPYPSRDGDARKPWAKSDGFKSHRSGKPGGEGGGSAGKPSFGKGDKGFTRGAGSSGPGAPGKPGQRDGSRSPSHGKPQGPRGPKPRR